jgi:putative hydrolase of the HAD superfamily
VIKAVIFDFFGVLTIDHTRRLSASVESKDLRTELQELTRQTDLGVITRDEHMEGVSRLLGMSVAEIRNTYYGHPDLDRAVVRLVESSRTTHKTALLSNASSTSLDPYLSPQQMERLFDVVVVSAEVGMIKPDPRIFQLTADRLGMLPGECFFIDDIERNVTAARECGMRSTVFTSASDLERALAELA